MVSTENVDQVAEQSRVHAEAAEGSVSGAMPPNSDDVHLYVCTHGVRDCRCGDTGGAVGRAIRDELRRRREADPSDLSTRVKLDDDNACLGSANEQHEICASVKMAKKSAIKDSDARPEPVNNFNGRA